MNNSSEIIQFPVDNRPHPWDPKRIGDKGVLHHLQKSFTMHLCQDALRRQAVRDLATAAAVA